MCMCVCDFFFHPFTRRLWFSLIFSFTPLVTVCLQTKSVVILVCIFSVSWIDVRSLQLLDAHHIVLFPIWCDHAHLRLCWPISFHFKNILRLFNHSKVRTYWLYWWVYALHTVIVCKMFEVLNSNCDSHIKKPFQTKLSATYIAHYTYWLVRVCWWHILVFNCCLIFVGHQQMKCQLFYCYCCCCCCPLEDFSFASNIQTILL